MYGFGGIGGVRLKKKTLIFITYLNLKISIIVDGKQVSRNVSLIIKI